MLYSPILSCLRIFPFLVWSVILAFFQVIYHFLLRRNFFLFYKIFFKGLIKIFGIKVNIKGRKSKKNVLFVSNHISYLDIFVLGSSVDGVFVASQTSKTIYLVILISHIILSIVLIPLVLLAYSKTVLVDFVAHKKIARIAFPIWLYVAITGPVVYYLLRPYY